jgi:phosphoglycolate phosphatase
LRIAAKRGEEIVGHSIPARQVVVIGDNRRDVEAGKAIGATTVAVASGPMSYDVLAATRPDFIFHDLSDTPTVIRHLLSQGS